MSRNHRPVLCRIAALMLAGVMVLSLTACGRRNQNSGDGIPESTGGKDLARAELADNVFSLNSLDKRILFFYNAKYFFFAIQ